MPFNVSGYKDASASASARVCMFVKGWSRLISIFHKANIVPSKTAPNLINFAYTAQIIFVFCVHSILQFKYYSPPECVRVYPWWQPRQADQPLLPPDYNCQSRTPKYENSETKLRMSFYGEYLAIFLLYRSCLGVMPWFGWNSFFFKLPLFMSIDRALVQ